MGLTNILIVFATVFIIGGQSINFEFRKKHKVEEEHPWTGKWFPSEPTEPSVPHDHGRVPMGVHNPNCDDAEQHLEVDWLDDPVNYTCYDHLSDYTPNLRTRPIYEIENVPPSYVAAHSCMNESIQYDKIIPTFGTHRPLWPQWGEYTFLPKQRWLHSLEHGGIVMLYHPCANKVEVKKLRSLVNQCLYRHVITPYNLLPPEMPLALVAWGSRLQMSAVSKKVVMAFIKEAALRGPEHTAKNGQYGHMLLTHAKIVSTETDDTLCPYLY